MFLHVEIFRVPQLVSVLVSILVSGLGIHVLREVLVEKLVAVGVS